MPLTRYRVRSEYGLADPELYRAADKDDPEALLEGVAMAGLVGVLRQLGDLAEFAAEIFHELHEEVMATSARGHGLMVRVQQLETEFPPIEKALLTQTTPSSFFYNAGVDWHPNLRSEQNLIARGDLPRFVMDSYEESRGPPRLFLLDKFDVAGAGACLKRYTDPSFFKVEAGASEIANVEIPREKKNRRMKKKGLRWRNGETTPEVLPMAHTKLHQLFLEERIQNGHGDPARLVKLKKRHLNGSVIDSKTGKSYMEKFVETPSERETSIVPVSFTPDYTSESGIRILEISTVSPAEKSPSQTACSSPIVHEDGSKPSSNCYVEEVDDTDIIKVLDASLNDETFERSFSPNKVQVEKQLSIYGEGKPKGIVNGYESDDVTSEVDNYMDALASMESEIETDNEYRRNATARFLKVENHGTDSEANEEHLERRARLSDCQSVGNFSTSDDGNNSFKKNSSSFSYSDSPSSLVENTPSDSDGGPKVFPSNDTCGAGIVDKLSNELSGTAVSPGATSHEHFVPRDMCTREENTPAHGDASSSALFSDLYSSLDPAASLSLTSPERPKTGGTAADFTATDSKVPDTFEDGLGGPSQISSQINDDLVNTSERHLMDELEDEDPNAKYLSNISEIAPEKERIYTSVNEGFEILDKLDVPTKSLFIYENETPSIVEKQLHASSSTDLQNKDFPGFCDISDIAKPDNLVTEVDDGVTAARSSYADAGTSNVSEEVPTVDPDPPSSPGIKEQKLPDLREDVLHLEPVSAEADVLSSSKKPDIAVISEFMDIEEMGGSSRSFEHAIGDNVASEQHPSISLSDSGDANSAELDPLSTETAEVEAAAIHLADVSSSEDGVSNGFCLPRDVCTPSRSHANLQEPLMISVGPDQKEAEFDDGISRDSDLESETFRDPQYQEFASADFGMSTNISASHHHSSICDDIEDLSPAGKSLNSLSVIDSTVTSTALDTRDQESESGPSSQLCSSEHAATRPFSYPPDPGAPENSVMLLSHQVDSEYLVTDEAGPHPEFVLEWSDVRADRLHTEHTEVDQANIFSSSFPSEHIDMGKERGEQIESIKYTDEEEYRDSSLDFSHENLPSQFSKAEFPSISAGQEVNHTQPAFPSTTLVPEASQVDLGELPPLPPLPPMQWRMGMGMGMGMGRSLFPAIQPSREDDKAQVELPAPHDEMQQRQIPFFPVGEDEKCLHYADPVTFDLAQPPPPPMQVPNTVNDANSQYNYADEPQTLNPFLTLPAMSSEKDGLDHLAVKGEIVQSRSTSVLPEPTSQGTTQNHDVPHMATQPLNQTGPEAGLVATTDQKPLQHSEGEQGNLVLTSKPPLASTDGPVRLGLLMPEGETTWLSNNSGAMPGSEDGKPNGNSVNKLPRPRNPLIDAVNAHGKSKLRKVAERVRPQLGPKADERDSMLEQIRTRSFNLKPAAMTRPSIPGPTPKTNLKVAAILEKANAIRQALAGSDDEDDDNWD